MSKALKMYFKNSEDESRILILNNPKDGITQDEVKTAMETVVTSTALVGCDIAVKATLTESDTSLLYEA